MADDKKEEKQEEKKSPFLEGGSEVMRRILNIDKKKWVKINTRDK